MTATVLVNFFRSHKNSYVATVLIILKNRPTLNLRESLEEAYASVCAIVLRERRRTMYFRLPFV